MSLVRIAARMAIVRALRGVTAAENHVYDSLIGGIQVGADGELNIGDGEKRPFIAVFTDASKHEKPDRRSFSESGATEVVIEWGISAGMVETDPETGESHIVAGLVATDSAFEFTLDLIGRQIADALNDPANEWAEIWRTIAAGGFAKIERARSSNDRDGTRIAAHQLRITTMLMDEPAKGEALPEPFPVLFNLLAESEDVAEQKTGELMAATLGLSDEDWQALQRRFGMAADEVAALGVGPIEGDDERTEPVMESASLAINEAAPIDVSAE